jgi:hypothetical protein
MDAPERYEQLIAFLESQLPRPVNVQEDADGSMHFAGGEPPEVVASITQTSVIVYEFAAAWTSSQTLTSRPRRVGSLKWRRLPEGRLFDALGTLIKGAREARASAFRACTSCGRSTAPEWMYDDEICRMCAEHEQSLTVVH